MGRTILMVWGIMAVASGCRISREIQAVIEPEHTGLEGLEKICLEADTVRTVLIRKAAAMLEMEDQRYEVTLTLYSKRDSIIYMTATGSGFEVLRASVDRDSIKVIDRINRTVYRTPLRKRYGYAHPVEFEDLQNIFSEYYLCDEMEYAREVGGEGVEIEYGREMIRKRIRLNGTTRKMSMFEFYHGRTNEYIMGERSGEGWTVYSDFMVSKLVVRTSGGEVEFNREVEVRMDVNPRRYGFVDIQ